MAILEEGRRVEHYRVIRWLGSGASGESYEAEDTRRQQKVTLKLIHPEPLLPESARRHFLREMQGISTLTHAYLASVFGYGESQGRLYVARHYGNAGSLLSAEGRDWFRPPLRINKAISYAYQLAQALQSIHDARCLHGSLTLSNVLVVRRPNVENGPDFAPFLISDVGLAHFVRRFGQSPVTLLPITVAPEQLGQRVTVASDQYALAVLLYYWLAGRPPFLGSPEEIEQLKLTETIASLTPLNAQVTPEQEGIIRKALSVYPEERFSSVLAFAEALLASTSKTTPRSEDSVRAEQEPPAPQPGPIPQTQPDVPQPSIEPSPLPDIPVEPERQPEPPAEPTPEPEVLPQPTPDIPQPLPDPIPLPPTDPTAQWSTTLPQEQAPLPTPTTPARFFVIGPNKNAVYEVILTNDLITIGCAGLNDILLDQDTLTSRHHALLKRESGHYVLYDRHSAHGVYVNGQKLEEDQGHVLLDGDSVGIGEYTLVYHLQEASSSFATAPHVSVDMLH